MTPHELLEQALRDVGRPLRGLSGLTRVLMATACALAILAVVAWWARVSGSELVLSVILTWLVVIAVLTLGWLLARRSMRTMGSHWVANALEGTGAWRRGALTHVLDPVAEGTSPSLRHAAVSARVGEIRERADAALDPAFQRARQIGRRAAAGVLAAAVLLLAARPLEGTPARLWNPFAAWTALTAPVRLSPRDSAVARGEVAVFDLVATGHRRAMLYTRTPGAPWDSTEVTLDASGHGSFSSQPLQAEIIARLEAGGRTSAEARVTIKLPAFLGSFIVTAKYPAYLGLEPEALSLGGDTLIIPEGTLLDLAGRATVPLASVDLEGPGQPLGLTVDGLAFRGSFSPRVSGTWQLRARPSGGAALDGEQPQLPIRIVADSAPTVEISVPGVDTIAPPTLQLGLLIALRDDHGLRNATVETRRSGPGRVMGRIALDVGKDQPDRALLSAQIDLNALGLPPGDTLYYRVVATDNAPNAQRGASREYWVRVPTAQEQRAAQDAATRATEAGFDSLAAAANRTQRQTEDLAKERSRGDTASSANGGGEAMTADAARKAEAVVKAQEKLLADAKRMSQAVEDLKQSAQAQGTADSAFGAQLDELRRLMRQADSPELRDALAALQQALKQLDPEATRNAMQNLAQKQGEFENAMKQARELFKRAAMEADLSNLSQEAKQLSDEQKDLASKLDRAAAQNADSAKTAPDSAAKKAIADQQSLATKADSLAASIDRAAQKVSSDSVRDGLKQSAEQTRDAGKQMQQAAQNAQQGKQKESQQNTKAAQEKLSKVEKDIKEQKEELQQEMKEEVLLALDRALAETARLTQREMQLIEDFRRGGVLVATRAEQSVVDDAAGRLLAQVNTIAGKNALVPQQIGVALAAARTSMRNAVDAVASLSPDLGAASAFAGEAVDALAFAAFSMLRAKDRVGDAESGSGMEEAISEMQQAAEQQGKAAKEAGQQMQSGDTGPQQMMQMAMQQRAVAQQLERLRAGGQMPGASEMMKEAKDLARELELGQLSKETVERQQRLYKRMLDAGRQLQGEEDQDERERKATTAKDGSAKSPPALDPRLRMGESIKLPSWETLQKLSPDERRRVLEYFQRLTEVKRP